jgi:hypothetical protein
MLSSLTAALLTLGLNSLLQAEHTTQAAPVLHSFALQWPFLTGSQACSLTMTSYGVLSAPPTLWQPISSSSLQSVIFFTIKGVQECAGNAWQQALACK